MTPATSDAPKRAGDAARGLLVDREAPPSHKVDAWGELNHLDENYLEFSTASDIPRGVMLVLSLFCVGFIAFDLSLVVGSPNEDASVTGFVMLALPSLVLGLLGLFMLRLDLRLPRDRPVRFNRNTGKVYIHDYVWTHNPFGRWGGRMKVLDWNAVQARITQRVGASGELPTRRYDLELVSPASEEGAEPQVIRLQRGAVTTRQYEEQWEYVSLYMQGGLDAVPAQALRDATPRLVDCLLFAMPWFAPTKHGQQVRARMGAGYWSLAVLVSLLFPLWLLFGVGNFVVMRLAPPAAWPAHAEQVTGSSFQ
jgi:hypothetical protein